MKVGFKYNEELKEYIKSVGGKWDPDSKMWDVPDEAYDDVRYKAMDLGVALQTIVGQSNGAQTKPARTSTPAPTPTAPTPTSTTAEAPRTVQSRGQGQGQGQAPRQQGAIWLGRSKDGRYLIMRINLVAFAEDVQAVLSGEKRGARFRVMMPRTQS